jgi:site-specific recombinase XerD
MSKFNSFIHSFIESFISYQKASKHWNQSYEENVLLFDRYLQKYYRDANILTNEMINGWCQKRNTELNNSCRSRTFVIATLIKYLRDRELSDVNILIMPKLENSIYIPHAFTEAELVNFFYECDHICLRVNNFEGKVRKITVPVFFRLLYSSGLRTTEARLLRISDVDLATGILSIRLSKGYDEHFVVLHDSMLKIMVEYDIEIKKITPNRTYFFPARKDGFHTRAWVHNNFRQMWDVKNSTHAIPYELRHHYATKNINQWIDKGFDFDAKLVYLSKSMGHTVLESTKYYYSLVPALAELMEKQSNTSFEEIIPEVLYEESN